MLLDTHLLLWAVARSSRLHAEARRMVLDAANQVYFSAASIWEIAIKGALRRSDFDVDVLRLAETLVRDGYLELPVTAAHAARVAALAAIHRDPFDRLLVAQSLAEPMTLLTNDALLGRYGSTVKVI
ncbi:MAG: type II toxin-antitoxin system VapC family toxin [Betaproteobacteria bacterium]